MKDTEVLDVWYENRLIGQLWRDPIGRVGFQYDEHWIENGFAISQQLPLRTEEYMPDQGIAHQYFVNLLPEANARLHIVRDLKIANSDFELLKAIGGECAGALSILPTQTQKNTAVAYEKLSKQDLQQIIRRHGRVSNFVTGAQRPRLSLAGAQDKCAIYYVNDDYYLPLNASPSSHILKFEVSEYKNIPVYEYFLMKLAKKSGLPVVDLELKTQDHDYYLLITRYDRIIQEKNVITRLHQEDFCQALGFSYEKKYQQHGGPSFVECYNLVRQVSSNPVEDLETLLKWQIFNVLAGNSDGHAKNLALLYNDENQPKLAPFYDLVCTRAIRFIDTQLAFAIGGEYNPDKLSVKHWLQMAVECQVREKYFLTLLQESAETLMREFPALQNEFEEKYGDYPALQRIQKVISKQCNKVLKAVR